MSRNLHDLNFFELKIIASRVVGKKATVANVMHEGAEQTAEEFNLKSCAIARAANLILCSKGQHRMLCSINKIIGDDAMKKLTVTSPGVELFDLVHKADIVSENLAFLLSSMATRQTEIAELEEKQASIIPTAAEQA